MPQRKESPLFSVIIPTLAKVDIWLEAIYSVQTQTNTDWEIIAIDSGPESTSRPLIEKLSDPRIIYVNTSAGNPHLNWDVGYRKASGKYLMWLDDDNYLLPFALEVLAQLISEGHPTDFATANHMHWNDLHHPIDSLRNHLAIPPRFYSGEHISINSGNAVKKLLSIPYEGSPIFARFHTSAQAVRREIVDALIERIGKIDFGSTSTHALRIGSLALSKTILFADLPIALIAQSGLSMSVVWPNESSSISHVSYQYNLSEVHGNTYTNYVHENHLLLKKLFAKDLAAYNLPQDHFLKAYTRSLIYLKLSWPDLFRFWLELWRVIYTAEKLEVRSLRGLVVRCFPQALAAKVLRTLNLYQWAKRISENKRGGKKGHILIDLAPYGTRSMAGVARILPEVLGEKFKIHYTSFVHAPTVAGKN